MICFWPIASWLLGMLVVFVFVPRLLKWRLCVKLLGRTGDVHHTHQVPVPRAGGLCLAVAFVAVELFITLASVRGPSHGPGCVVILISSLAMFALGFWDDIKPLGAKRKLVGQVVISLGVCVCGISIQNFKIPFSERIISLNGWGMPITVLWLVGLTNLINLIDGADGLAGGICLMLMVLVAYVTAQDGHLALLESGMVGALLGFLWFNFPPARVYLGDGGAYFLGFQIGLFSIVNSHKGSVFGALLAPLFVLALPILDTTLAIIRRGLQGLPIFRPDRRHIHHQLLNMGFSRRRAVLSLYGMTLLFLAMGVLVFWSRGDLAPVLAGVGALVVLFCAGKLKFSREWFSVRQVVGKSLAIRREVQYARCLLRWLEKEGGRATSLESLWVDFSFIAQKLGFSYVKVILADGERIWELPQRPDGPTRSYRYPVEGGRCGLVELKAWPEEVSPGEGLTQAGERTTDPDTFEILSELLAEGWGKATKRWRKETVLRFDVAMPRRREARARKASRSFVTLPVAKRN
jgi:UDP-GlcNAc:undecaprenyl-phosphate GlcNAc-1-phosphate transferase